MIKFNITVFIHFTHISLNQDASKEPTQCYVLSIVLILDFIFHLWGGHKIYRVHDFSLDPQRRVLFICVIVIVGEYLEKKN